MSSSDFDARGRLLPSAMPISDATIPPVPLANRPRSASTPPTSNSHENLVSRRRKREVTLVRKCQELHLYNECEVYLVIHHRGEDYSGYVIYNSEPDGEDWPRPYERMRKWYPRPEINTPTKPAATLRKALAMMDKEATRDGRPLPSNNVPSGPSPGPFAPPASLPPPMFKQNKPMGLGVQANGASLGSPITFPDTPRRSVGCNEKLPMSVSSSRKRPAPVQFAIDIPSKRARQTPVEPAHLADAEIGHTTSPSTPLSSSPRTPSPPPAPCPAEKQAAAPTIFTPHMVVPTGRGAVRRNRCSGKFARHG